MKKKILDTNLSNFKKKIFLIFSDLIIISLSILISFSLRLEKFYSPLEINILIYLLYFVVFLSIFSYFNIYQILIRYFDNFSILKIIKAIFIIQIILIIINYSTYEMIYFPRSVSFIAPILIAILIVTHRIILNYLLNSNKIQNHNENKILIFGINENTVSLLNSLRQFPVYGVVEGFIDTQGNYKKREVNGIKIYKYEELSKVFKEKKITEIIYGPNKFSEKNFKKVFNMFSKYNIRIRKISDTKHFIKNFINKSLENSINFYEIVNRPKIIVNDKILKNKIYKKNIIVTGGAGSIGSELCLEILKYSPNKVFVLDTSEINLYNLKTKIKNSSKNLKFILGDCSDYIFLEKVFKNETIDEIYHAAAYKHVSFGEENSHTMIKNNILGTKKIIEFACKNEIKNFTFISSDKAVNPKSILGYTKKIGEKLLNEFYLKYSKKKELNFSIVRFGNVIGSSGSVIPLFLEQVKNKEFLTVTNKNSERYFMSISEAVRLVINSSYINKSGFKIFALNMGKQLKIYDIASRIIKLSGYSIKNKFNPKGDISIKIIGLKKGEKISEEISLGQNLASTTHNDIMKCLERTNSEDIINQVIRLEEMLNKDLPHQKYLKKIAK